jgi:hypothetical protein
MKIQIKTLPDIHSYRQIPKEYDRYGRFGITTRDFFFVLPVHSQHPNNTKIGGYWAYNESLDTLYLSPRGASFGFKEFIMTISNNELNSIKRLCK